MNNFHISFSQSICSTIEEFAVNTAGHSIRPIKIQPGIFNSYYSLVEASDFLLMIRQVEHQYFEAGEFKPNTHGFAFMSNNGSIVYNRRKYKSCEKLITKGRELDSILSSNLRMVNCFIDDANLSRYFSADEIEQFHTSITIANHKSKRAKSDNDLALYLNNLIMNLSKKSLVISNELIYKDLCADIYLRLYNYTTDTHENSCAHVKPKHRLNVLQKSLDFIHSADITTLVVTDIAQYVHTSQRNLQKLFLQYLDISPKTYLVGLRLKKIHQALKLADPKHTNVRDISTKYGAIHQGNFAKDYFHFFGEYPKDTLRQL